MKFFKILFSLLLLSLVLPNFITAETEPNNAYSQASTLGLNITDNGAMSAIAPIDDYDWWKVILPTDGSLYIEANTAGGMDVELYKIRLSA